MATVSPFPSGGRLGWERRAVFSLPFIARSLSEDSFLETKTATQ